MLLQRLPQCLAQDAHAAAVDYAHAGQAGEKCVVDEFFDCASRVVHVKADDVDFGGRVLAFVARATPKSRAPALPSRENLAALLSTSAMSSRAIFIFIAPTSTSK